MPHLQWEGAASQRKWQLTVNNKHDNAETKKGRKLRSCMRFSFLHYFVLRLLQSSGKIYGTTGIWKTYRKRFAPFAEAHCAWCPLIPWLPVKRGLPYCRSLVFGLSNSPFWLPWLKYVRVLCWCSPKMPFLCWCGCFCCCFRQLLSLPLLLLVLLLLLFRPCTTSLVITTTQLAPPKKWE